MTSARSSKTARARSDEADPRFLPVAAALARTRGFSLMESKSRAMRGMMLNGKSFGMSTHGRFILKMSEERVAELVAGDVGEPFRHGRRVMKGWIEITHPKADWVALAREALRLAAGSAKRPNKTAGVVATIDDYLAGVPGPKRAALAALRKTIRSIVPRAEECISYRMPAFRVDGRIVAGFCATAKGCSYFPFSGSTLKTLARELEGYSQTKSALHFRADEPLRASLVRKLIAARAAEKR
jgi:uncharacterized protein YdhG (YjbR/CyaY superfamily)